MDKDILIEALGALVMFAGFYVLTVMVFSL